MNNSEIAYKPGEDCTPEVVQQWKVDDMHGYQYIIFHFIFDVKMNFIQKDRLVANGHNTEAPVSLIYSNVVSRDSVQP